MPNPLRDPKTLVPLAELALAGSLTAVSLVAGNLPTAVLMGTLVGIGGNWLSDLSERGFHDVCDRWLAGRDRRLNHDIAYALCQALADATAQLGAEWRDHPHYAGLRHRDPDAAQRTLEALAGLGRLAPQLFTTPAYRDAATQAQETNVAAALAAGHEGGARALLEQAMAAYFHGHERDFVAFVQARLADAWMVGFGEHLKDPGPAGSRAWRAYQRLWQQGMGAALAHLQEDAAADRQVLAELQAAQARLQSWLERLQTWPDTRRREPTGLEALTDALAPLGTRLDEIRAGVERIEAGVDAVQMGVTALLQRVETLQASGAQARQLPEWRSVLYGVEALPRHYVPRDRELARLRAALLEGDGVALTALQGMGGVGKTVLARALARDPACAARYPDGVLWGQLGPEARDEDAADPLLREWGLALGLGDLADFPTPAARARLLAHCLQARRLLLVIDDVWHSPPARLLQQVRGAGCGLLVTTRLPAVGAALELDVLRLDVLRPDEALALLAARRGRPLAADELEPARELVARLGYHPLAVQLAAAQLGLPGRRWSILLQPLRRRQGQAFTALDLDQAGRESSLQVCFDLSYHSLDEGTRRRYCWLGVMAADAPFDAADVEVLWRPDFGVNVNDWPGLAGLAERMAQADRADEEFTPTDAEKALLAQVEEEVERQRSAYAQSVPATLRALLDAALLEEVADDDGPRYRQHLLLREDALARLDGAERAAALQRHARIYRGVAD